MARTRRRRHRFDAWDYVLARVAIDFRREVCWRMEKWSSGTAGADRQLRLALSEEITKRDGTVAAEAEAVVVARDTETGRSRPLTPAERTAFESTIA